MTDQIREPGRMANVRRAEEVMAKIPEYVEKLRKERSLSMFPPDECIRIHKNVFIQKPRYNGKYQLWFQSGCQYFPVQEPVENEELARWHAKMLVKALEKMMKTKEIRIDVEMFKGEGEMQQFIAAIEQCFEESNLVPVYHDGELICYAVPPDSPLLEDL